MNKLLLILLCVPLIGLGQQTYIPDDYYFAFKEKSYQYLIADNVNIRTSPSKNSSIITTLPIGSRLIIIEELTYRYTYNNISFPWYKVSFILNNSEKIGYVVGGFIAQEYASAEGDLILLSGLSKYYPDGRVKRQIRVVKQNKEIDKIEFFPVYDDYHYFEFDVRKNYAINNGVNIVQVRVRRAMCGYQSNETTFFLDRDKLYHLRTFTDADKKLLGYANGRVQLYKLKWVVNDLNHKDGGEYRKEIIKEYIWDGNRLKTF